MSRKSVFILLDPYVPEGSYEHLSQVLAALVEKGWCNFVVNNLAHIEMLKGKKVNLLGGPYLYTFNKWAVSFLENQNIMAFIPPVEDSSDNLEQTFKTPEERGRALLTVFSYPVLFRMRFKLPEDYDFEAHKQLVPMQPGDVPVTYADTSALERDYGFKPSTSLRDGLRAFAEWYREFYQIED